MLHVASPLPLAAVAAALAAACAHATSTPRLITLRDSGKTLAVRKGAELQLRLPELRPGANILNSGCEGRQARCASALFYSSPSQYSTVGPAART
jgi:hypothetical protein